MNLRPVITHILGVAICCLSFATSASTFASEARFFEEYDKLLPKEPTLPNKICTRLSASLTYKNWVLPDEVDNDPAKSNPDTTRLQTALNKCPAGTAVKLVSDGDKNAFLVGPFEIPSGVTLWVDKDIRVFASRSPKDYDLGDGMCGDVHPTIKNRCKTWITANDTVNSGVVGEGTLDARGGSVLTSGKHAFKVTWWDLSIQSKAKPKLEQNNPRMMHITGGKNFTLYKINIQNAAKFHIVTTDIDGVTAWGMKLLTPSLAYTKPGYKCDAADLPSPGKMDKPSTCFVPELVKNTDGFDPSTSKNVTLAYSFISTGDDNVAIKSGDSKKSPATQHQLYAHNHFYYGHGMSIGSETDAGVNNVRVWDLIFDGNDSTHGVGLRIKTDGKRGGAIFDVIYRDVCMRRVKEALVFSPYYSDTEETKFPPSMTGIVLRNYHYVDAKGANLNSSTLDMSGYMMKDIINPLKITLDNVVFDTKPKMDQEHHHNIDFTFGPGPVVNFPLVDVQSIHVTDKQTEKTEALACPDEIFAKYPSDESPF